VGVGRSLTSAVVQAGRPGAGASAGPEKATATTIVSKTARCSDLAYQTSASIFSIYGT
jgi:hypothetical protein